MEPGVLMQKVVRNPNFEEDAVRLLALKMSLEEFSELMDRHRKASALQVKRLEVLVDKMEFIDHLRHVAGYVKKEKYRVDGVELDGFDHDVNALRVYLALTCVDILTSEAAGVGQRFKAAFRASSMET